MDTVTRSRNAVSISGHRGGVRWHSSSPMPRGSRRPALVQSTSPWWKSRPCAHPRRRAATWPINKQLAPIPRAARAKRRAASAAAPPAQGPAQAPQAALWLDAVLDDRSNSYVSAILGGRVPLRIPGDHAVNEIYIIWAHGKKRREADCRDISPSRLGSPSFPTREKPEGLDWIGLHRV